MANPLEFLITAKDLASAQFEKLSSAVEKTSGKTDKWKAIASVASAAVVGGVTYMAKQSVDAYMDAETQQQALQDAYKKFPALAHGNIEALRNLNTAIQAKTGYDDDDMAGMESTLAMYGANQKQLEKLAPIVVDFASKTGRSLQDSARAVGMALTGNARALREVGIQYKANGVSAQGVAKAQDKLSKATQVAADAQRHLALLKAEDAGKSHLSLSAQAALTNAQIKAKRAAQALAKAHDDLKTAQQGATDKSKTLDDVTGLLAKKVGGFAEGQGKTAAGQMRILGTEFQNVQETVGQLLLPVFTALGAVMATVFEWLNAHRPVVIALVAIIGVLTLGIIGANVAMWAMAAAEAAVLWPILIIVGALIALIVVIVLVVSNWKNIVSFLKTVWGAVCAWVVSVVKRLATDWNKTWTNIGNFFRDTWNHIVSFFRTVVGAIVNWAKSVWTSFRNWWNGFWAAIGKFIANVWNNGIVAPIRNAINSVVNWAKGVWSSFRNWWNGFWSGVGSTVANIWNNGIVNPIKRAIALISTGVRVGLGVIHNVWSNIWNGLIGIVRGVMNSVIGAVQGGINGAIDIINGLIGAFNSVAGLVHIHVSAIPHVSLGHFASGTSDAPGGFAVVGENGPEVMNVPAHAQITPHGKSATVRLHPEDIRAIGRMVYAMIQEGAYVAIGDALGG